MYGSFLEVMEQVARLKLLSYNVQCFGAENDVSRDATVDAIVGSAADVVLLQETNDEWARALEGCMAARYQHRGVVQAGEKWPSSANGMLVYSIHPIVVQKQINVRASCEDSWFDAWFGIVEIGHDRVGICSVHLRPPFDDDGRATLSSMGFSSKYRVQEMEVILEAIRTCEEWFAEMPLIIAGDFNESDSHQLCTWLRGIGMNDALALYRGHTHWWPVKNFTSQTALVLRNRLDHIFYSSTVSCHELTVIDNEGVASDHLPLICDLHLVPHSEAKPAPSLPFYVYTGAYFGFRTLAEGSIWVQGRKRQ